MSNPPIIISEKWIRNRLLLDSDVAQLSVLSLPGIHKEKIGHLGVSLQNFVNLKHINLDRNSLDSLDGLQFCKKLEKLTVYYNNITVLDEILRLRANTNLKELDLRLNPITKVDAKAYRMFTIYHNPSLIRLDEREVRESERRMAREMYDGATDIATPPSLMDKLIPQEPQASRDTSLTEQDLSDIQQLNTKYSNFDEEDDLPPIEQLQLQHLQHPTSQARSPHTSPHQPKRQIPQQHKQPQHIIPIQTSSLAHTQSHEQANGYPQTNGKPQQHTFSPPANPQQHEFEKLISKVAKYKETKRVRKALEAENQQMKFHIDALQHEYATLQATKLDLDKRLENSYAAEQRLHELIDMLKEAHSTIITENKHLHEEIENWKARDAANTALWQSNYDSLKRHIQQHNKENLE